MNWCQRALRVAVLLLVGVGLLALTPTPSSAEEAPVAGASQVVPVLDSEACQSALDSEVAEAIELSCTADATAGPGSVIGECWDYVEIEKIHIGLFGWFRQVWADYRSACEFSPGTVVGFSCVATLLGAGGPPFTIGFGIASLNDVCTAQTFPFSTTFMGAPYLATGRTYAIGTNGRLYMTVSPRTDLETV